MTGNVAIVVVSHSPEVARGTADMVREMVGEEVRVAHCGGNPAGGLGTDVAAILAAIEAVYTPKGVAILVLVRRWDGARVPGNRAGAGRWLPDPR